MSNYLKENSNILVTGGAGFIGGELIRRLLRINKFRIYNLDKFGYASDISGITTQLKSLETSNEDRYQTLKVNLNNFEDTSIAVKNSDPDLVFHLAAESHVDRSIDNPKIFIESNINGTFNLLQSLRIHWEQLSPYRKKTFRLIHISTDEVYGSLGDLGLFSENTSYSPRSPYSASKAASDHLVNAWHHTYGLPIIITNCSNNFGPWQFPEKFIPVVILKALSGKSIPVYGDGTNVRDWLFVEDHIDALLLASLKGKIGNSYCVGGTGEMKNNDLVHMICEILDNIKPTKKSYSTLIEYVKDRPGHDKRYSIDSTKIRSELGWYPKHSVREGLFKTINWYIENLDWCHNIMVKSGFNLKRIGDLDK